MQKTHERRLLPAAYAQCGRSPAARMVANTCAVVKSWIGSHSYHSRPAIEPRAFRANTGRRALEGLSSARIPVQLTILV